jgi:hypothetical protein
MQFESHALPEIGTPESARQIAVTLILRWHKGTVLVLRREWKKYEPLRDLLIVVE